MKEKSEFIRVPVGLRPDDNTLLIRLQALLQAELCKRVSVAEIVRMALRELAKAKGL